MAQKIMMPGMTFEWTGRRSDQIELSGKAILIFGLGILVVYLTLSAQYEELCLAIHHSLGGADGGSGAHSNWCICAAFQMMCTARSAS